MIMVIIYICLCVCVCVCFQMSVEAERSAIPQKRGFDICEKWYSIWSRKTYITHFTRAQVILSSAMMASSPDQRWKSTIGAPCSSTIGPWFWWSSCAVYWPFWCQSLGKEELVPMFPAMYMQSYIWWPFRNCSFCFCCCRCAGACGGRSQPFDKKHDTCRRVWLGFLLILAGTGMM